MPRHRCLFDLKSNALAFLPKPSTREAVVAGIRAVFDAPGRPEAESQLENAVRKYRTTAPGSADWLEADIPEGLAVFPLPPGHHRRLRTMNPPERLNKESKRRTRVAGLLPDEESALRLASTVLLEVSEEGETGRKYLTILPD